MMSCQSMEEGRSWLLQCIYENTWARESGGFAAGVAAVGLCGCAHCHGDGGNHGDRDGRCLPSAALPACEGRAAFGGAH